MNKVQMHESLKIKFDGQLHQVDANTLINSLVNFSTAIQEINSELNPGQNLNIKINAPEKGSFILDILLEIDAVEVLINTAKSASYVVGVFAGILTIKKHLSGKEPKEIIEKKDNIEIINNKGNIILADKVAYNLQEGNQVIQDAVSNTFDTLQNDPTVDGFEIESNEEKIFNAPSSSFPDLAIKSEVLQENKRTIKQVANLNIFKLVFEKKYKWEFFWQGNKISAYIVDANFFKNIDKGKKFSKGDILVAELEIVQIFNESVDTYINHSFRVLRVMSHIPRGEQRKLL